jgi:hypothetical protein
MNLKMRLLIIKHLRILRFKGATRAIRFWGSLILTERQLAVGFESQRDSVSKPRVASRELPWVNAPKHRPTPTGLHRVSTTMCQAGRVAKERGGTDQMRLQRGCINASNRQMQPRWGRGPFYAVFPG